MQHFNAKFDQLKDIELEPIDKDDIIKGYNELDEELKNAKDGAEAVKVVRKYFDYEDDLSTIISLVNFRHTIDTRDEKYTALQDLLDEILPTIQVASQQFANDLYDSKYRKELVEAFGELYFDQVKLSMKTFKPEIVDDLIEENKESSAYVNLISSASIEFNGEHYSLSQMGKFTTSLDRETRLAASKKVWAFYEENDAKIGEIYDSMVKTRTKIAKKLGYENFVQLGYDRMGRLDWFPEDAKVYREKILKYIVPLSESIFAAQKERLGYGEDTRSSDYAIFYKTGNPTPKGTPDDLVHAAQQMYK